MINCIVIDDNSDIVGVIKELLEMIGHKVLATGTDGLQAMDLYEKYHPDLIFIDLKMPKYDGFYAINGIRKFDSDSNIIAMTDGNLTVDEYVMLNSLKPSAILYKPFSTKTLRKVVSNIFSN